MNENVHLAKAINEQLDANLPIVLISVMKLQGSTPRHEGTKMAVAVDGKIYGTIGGSLIEAAVIQESKQVLNDRKSKVFSFELNGKDATVPGMICGGTAEILLDYLPPSAQNREFARQWLDSISKGKDFFILTNFRKQGKSIEVISHAIMDTECNLASGSMLATSDIEKLKSELHNISTTAVFSLTDSQIMIDFIRKTTMLFCIGAGHVAVPTAHLAALAGFGVIVIDDRPEFANAERFPEAHRTIIVKDYNHALDGFEVDKDSFIVIVTRSHQYDREVLEQAINTSAGYIGMISSKRKRAAIFEVLMAKGVKKERLEWVHTPIGLDIGAETPEEIAVSVVAELIKVRSQQKV